MNYCSSNYRTDTTELHTNWVITGNSSSGTLANLTACGCVDDRVCIPVRVCVFDAGKPAVILSRNSRRDVHLRFLPPSPKESTSDAVFKMRRHVYGVFMVLLSVHEGFLPAD